MEKKWNRKNALWMLLYTVLYVIGTVVTCVLVSNATAKIFRIEKA